MTFNPSYAELLGLELQRDRMREAEKERLIRQVSGWQPSTAEKLFIITRSYWKDLWSRIGKKRIYLPVNQQPNKKPT